MRFHIRLIFLFLVFFSQASAQLYVTKDQYVRQYQDIAISEMDRSGIPASITLAQGILESRFGNSSLALEANNHFGIKCHNGWSGRTYYLEDDDRDRSGNLIESCFRAYSSPEESFMDHSEFLMTRDRYSFLFGYDKHDYKQWARGLKTAGYATNPKYADILIKLVIDNNLSRFDRMTSRVPVYNLPEKDDSGSIIIATTDDGEVEFEEPFTEIPEYGEPEVKKPFASKKRSLRIFRVNDIKTVSAGTDDSPLSIAQRLDISLSRLLRYNDLQLGEDLIPEQNVFLQPKRKKSRERKSYHRVTEGETMYSISQQYGVQLKELYRRNKLEINDRLEPEAGERIFLRGMANAAPKTKSASFRPPPRFMQNQLEDKPKSAPSGDESWMELPDPIIREKSEELNPEKYHLVPPVTRPVVTKPVSKPVSPETFDLHLPVTKVPKQTVVPKPEVITQPVTVQPQVTVPDQAAPKNHEVVSGDTLYNISNRYNLSVNELKMKNGLTTNLIRIGQILRID